jgi:photosystem II stability/assembly factor-like uncharacterized protein
MLTSVPIFVLGIGVAISSDISSVDVTSARMLRPSYTFIASDSSYVQWKYLSQFPVALFDPEDSPAASFVGLDNWSMLTKDSLYQSADRGRTWQQRPSNLPKAYEPFAFVQIDSQVAWAVVVDRQTQSGWPMYQLLRTRDDGVRWERLQIPMTADQVVATTASP